MELPVARTSGLSDYLQNTRNVRETSCNRTTGRKSYVLFYFPAAAFLKEERQGAALYITDTDVQSAPSADGCEKPRGC